MILKLIKSFIFDIKKQRAIREACRRAKLENRKFLVLLHDGRLHVVSNKGIKELIRKRFFKRSFTIEKAHDMALFIAYPTQKR